MRLLSIDDSTRVLNALLALDLDWDSVHPTFNDLANATHYMSEECKTKNLNFKFKISALTGHIIGIAIIIQNGDSYDDGIICLIDHSLLSNEKYKSQLTNLLNNIQQNDYFGELMSWMDKMAKYPQ